MSFFLLCLAYFSIFRGSESGMKRTSQEDLKNLESLRSSTQNPVEKDFFFKSLNEDDSLEFKLQEELDELLCEI